MHRAGLLLAALVLVAFAVGLLGFAVMAFWRPARARRFLGAFAQTSRAHLFEQNLRLLAGVALIVRAPTMWQGRAFGVLGWVLVGTSVVLLLLPWRWHRRFAERVVPPVARHVRLYAVGVLTLGALLLFALLSPLTP